MIESQAALGQVKAADDKPSGRWPRVDNREFHSLSEFRRDIYQIDNSDFDSLFSSGSRYLPEFSLWTL